MRVPISAPFVLLALLTVAASAQTPILTRSGDNARSGDFQEATITVASLRQNGLTLRTTIPVIGDARGMEAQPLLLPGVKLADGSTHDVLILPSMANVVRGVDAHTGAGIWQTGPLGRPIQGSQAIDMHQINDKWGVLSTGVVDAETGLVYLVDWESSDGTPEKGIHFIYTLNVATGAVVGSPVSLAGLRNGTQGYNDTMRKQRTSLVETKVPGQHPMVFFGYGTVHEAAPAAAGAIVAYDTVLKKTTAFLPMSQGLGAGIWMGGQGLAADSKGNLYGVTGNGSFNGVNDFGESIFQITYTPANGTAPASLKLATWFSPFSDWGRIGLDPTKSALPLPLPLSSRDKVAGESAPSQEIKAQAIKANQEMRMPVGGSMNIDMSKTKTVLSRDLVSGKVTPLFYPKDPTDPAWSDEDLGSGGCTLIEAFGKLACGGKDGLLYVVNTANMGNTMPRDFANEPQNCRKLATPPVWFTASPGPVEPCPQDTTTLDFMPYGKTRHLHMTPVQYNSPREGMVIFGWGENSTLHKWKMAPSGAMTYVAESREVASIGASNNPGGMPGGFCALSSNHFATGTAILWCSIPLTDANAGLSNGRLIAYDPDATSADGDGPHLVKLWDSQDWGINYVFNKFMPPAISGGTLYLPNYNGGVMVFTQ